MEHEHHPPRERTHHVDPSHGNRDSGIGRDQMRNMLAHADHILDSLGPIAAEDYLLQNRQPGGQ